jgi:hypothetical protein
VTYEELHNAIRSRFKTEVAAAQTLTTIYDNDPTAPPTDGTAWCRWAILDGQSRPTVCGVSEYRLIGVAVAQLFGPLGRGDAPLQQHVDAIIAAFRGKAAAGVRYGSAYEQRVGQTAEGDYYQINVVCPFQADTQETER